MPTFEITTPDGAKYRVTGPDGATEQDALAQVQAQHGAAAPATAPVTAGGLYNAADTGVAKGVAELASLPRTIGEVGAKGIQAAQNFAVDKLGLPESMRDTRDLSQPGLINLPSYESALAHIQKSFYGDQPLHESQNTPENYMESVGKFLPNAIGPGGIVRKAASVVLPGVATEAVKEAGGGPVAQTAAALTGGYGAAKVGDLAERGARAFGKVAGPTLQNTLDAADAGYKSPVVAAVQIRPAAVDNLVDTVVTKIGGNKADVLAPKTAAKIERLRPDNATPATVEDLDTIRKSLREVAQDVHPQTFRPTPDARAATIGIKHIDDFLDNLKQPDLLVGNAAAAAKIMSEARGNYAAGMKALEAENKLKAGIARAETSGTGGNVGNAIRQEFRSDYVKPNKFNQQTGPTQEALTNLVRPGVGAQTMRALSAFDPTHSKLGLMLHAGSIVPGAMATGGASVLPQIGLGAAGFVARKGYDALMKSRAQTLMDAILAQSPLGRQMGATVPQRFQAQTALPQQLGAGLLSGLSAPAMSLGLLSTR